MGTVPTAAPERTAPIPTMQAASTPPADAVRTSFIAAYLAAHAGATLQARGLVQAPLLGE